MDKNRVPPGEPFPIEEIVSATPEEAEAFRDQSAVPEAAALIRQMRKSAGLSQRQLAALAGTSQPHLSELERGTGSQGPTFLMLQRIAKACGAKLRVEISDQRVTSPLTMQVCKVAEYEHSRWAADYSQGSFEVGNKCVSGTPFAEPWPKIWDRYRRGLGYGLNAFHYIDSDNASNPVIPGPTVLVKK